jgi:transcriptional regulator with XRE-family HTH domain
MTHDLIGRQIKAARAILGWSSATLAERAGLSAATIGRLERCENAPGSLFDVLNALERGGVVFTDGGVTLRRTNNGS